MEKENKQKQSTSFDTKGVFQKLLCISCNKYIDSGDMNTEHKCQYRSFYNTVLIKSLR
jgi:hypothetical protein